MTGVVAAAVVVLGAVALRALSRLRWRRPTPQGRSGPRWPLSHRPHRRPPAAWATEVAAAVTVPPARVQRAWWAVMALSPVLAALVSPAVGIVAAAVALAAPLLLPPALRRRADARFDADLPPALDLVARSLRAGASLRQALADAAADTPGRLGDDLRELVRRTSAGIPLREALDEWGRARPRPGVLLAAAALGLSLETGGASARAVDGVAATLRRRLSLQEEAAALSAQAHTSAVVLAAAPLAVGALTLAGGGGAADFLLRSPLGMACLVTGLALDAVGWWWMARLTRSPAAVPAYVPPPARTCVRIASPSTSIRTQVREALP